MKKRMRIVRCFCILSMLILPTTLCAQVTIGSAIRPRDGVLLDLKENDGTDANSNRGLGLPRVELTQMNDMSDLGVTNTENHEGMMVYHTTEDACNKMAVGIYIWTGNSWIELGRNGNANQESWIDNGDDTGILTDYEGNKYRTQRYDSKVWMVDNLRVKRKTDGEWLDCVNGMRFNPAYYNTTDGGLVVKSSIPVGNADYMVRTHSITENYDSFITKFGLLYTWAQANQACPQGWHLSTQNDWEELSTLLGGNAVAGKKIKSEDYRYTSKEGTVKEWDGYPINNTSNAGFHALPAGDVNPDGKTALLFGEAAYWWTEVNESTYHLTSLDVLLHGITHDSNHFFSVRCVKD